MITRVRGKTLRVLPFLFCLISAFTAPAAFSAPTDCVESGNDGRLLCASRYPKPWGYSLCDEAAPFASRMAAWCKAGGGTPNGTECIGGEAATEDTLVSQSVAFASFLYNDTCGVASDTGWGATFTSAYCWDGGQIVNEGYLIRDSRRLAVTCSGGGGELITALKDRGLECPAGFAEGWVVRRGALVYACYRELEPCDSCSAAEGGGGSGGGGGDGRGTSATAVGNPVMPATGVKVLSEADYRHARGLSFARNYHSFRFYKPFATPSDVPPPNQLGIVWRSNYEKRVIPLGVDPEVYALTMPTGEVQYFDNAGGEIFNYRGAKAHLVVIPSGYVYNGPEDTEFYRADGRLQSIARRSGEAFTLAYSDGTTGLNGGFTVDPAGNPTTAPLPANLLIRVTDSYGNALSFGYGLAERLVVMTDPGGGRTFYSYDKNENLTSVKYPDGRVRQYVYNEPANIPSGEMRFIHALTSVVDENGALFASYKYDGSSRANSTEHAGGAQRYQLTYNPEGTTSVTDPLGTVRTFTFDTVDGMRRLTGSTLPGGAGFGTGVKNRIYDTTGNVLSQTDFNNVKTCYAYDLARNLETVRVEGVPAATDCAALTDAGVALPAGTRKILTEWHARWRMPARTSEPSRRTTYVYNGDGGASCASASAVIPDGTGQPIGVLCTKTVQSTNDANGSQGFAALLEGQPRAWAYTYDARGKVLTADGPRTDVPDITTTTYYAEDDPDPGKRGNVATIANALGHVTQITAYSVHGQPLTIVDPNGLTTTLTYDARQRLSSRSVGGELTTYTYDGVGQLTQVTLPDGSSLTYSYDAAHRLTGMSDNLGNRIAYTLDPMGNRTKEEVFDPANSLAQTRSRVYNDLNRLFQEIGAQNQTTQYAYDNQGNLTSIDGPLEGAVDVTNNQYDALNRLVKVTDPNQGETRYAYNGIDQLVSVTDPRNLATTYNYDGLANLNSQLSPDTGATANTYDAAGNLLTQSDAKGQTTSYAYDALNRVTSISFADGSKQTYAYDQGANGLGRLSSITETDPQNQLTSLIAYTYDPRGRTSSETRTIGGVPYALAYSYDSAGRLSGMTYPSGRAVAYSFDALGRISQVNTTPPPSSGGPLVSNIAYHPFGGVKSYTLGNGQTYTRSYDLDGRIATYTLGAQTFALGYDAAGRVTFLQDNANPLLSNAYVYDALNRLTNAVLPALDFTYGYDTVGNRLSKSAGAASDSYAYGATSNRLASITPAGGAPRSFAFDANGSTTDDGANQYLYDARGRLVQSIGTAGATNYQVNALGQRIRKTNVNDDRVFLYDTRGRLIAETDPGGALKREYLYLNDIPLAVVQ